MCSEWIGGWSNIKLHSPILFIQIKIYINLDFMSNYSRPIITQGNDFTIRIAIQHFVDGDFVDFNINTVKSLEVYLMCSAHNQKIPLKWEIEPGFDNIISCFVDYYLVHAGASYGIGVEGVDENDKHFRWYMLPKEGILVISNTSGQNIPQDVEIVDCSARVGWGIEVNADLTNYYTKDETEQYVQDELTDYYDKGETDGLLNNKVDTSTLVNDYYNKNTVDNLLDTKADTSDLNNYYNKTQTDTLLNQKADVSDLNNKQDTLVSGENIKTVNNQSIIGSGNIDIQFSQVQSNWTETDTSNPSYIQNKPNLATVATSGDYDDLTNKPTIPAAQVQSDYNQSDNTQVDYIKNKPNLATVATSGSYNDLTNTPNLATVATSGDYDDLTNKPNLSQYATQTDLATKQDTLVSGTNIKTINNQSLLGSGNIDIQGGGENHDNADEATANTLFELNERLSEAEINIDIIPTEFQAKIDELEANVEQSLDELPPKFDEIDDEFKSAALVIEELYENSVSSSISGLKIEVVSALPANPENNCIYIITN